MTTDITELAQRARINAECGEHLSPAETMELVEALEKAQTKLDKIKSNSCHVDTSDGAFIPNSLDAWGRPVPQHLPYDFSGNPGASATQYCNGWNDAGGYWVNYVRELESRTVNPVTYSENVDADHCRKWAWQQVKGEVSTEGWTTGDNSTYFGFLCWGWDMRRQYNEQRPVTVKLPTTMYTEFEGDDFCREAAVLDKQLVIDRLAAAGIKWEDD